MLVAEDLAAEVGADLETLLRRVIERLYELPP
jgi:hypothetical protein